MTIQEVITQYGLSYLTTSVGDSINSVALRIYKEDTDKVRQILQSCNCRYDWFDLEPGVAIYYIKPELIKLVDEDYTK